MVVSSSVSIVNEPSSTSIVSTLSCSSSGTPSLFKSPGSGDIVGVGLGVGVGVGIGVAGGGVGVAGDAVGEGVGVVDGKHGPGLGKESVVTSTVEGKPNLSKSSS